MTQDIHRSGYCRRYHSNPELAHLGDTLAHHHGQVAQIILEFIPDPSPALIYEALHHDCGEMMVGDIAHPAKQADPELSKMLDASERIARRSMGCDERHLSNRDRRWLKFADRLQAYRHVQHVAPHVLKGNGWPEARTWLCKEADALGIKGEVV